MGNPINLDAVPAATNAQTTGVVSQQPTDSLPPPYVPPPQSNNPQDNNSQPRGNPDVVTPAANNAAPQTSAKGAPVNIPKAGDQTALAYPVATPLASLGERPMPVDCPFCGMRGMSTVQNEHSSLTHMSAALCCLLCICLVFVPYAAGFGDDHEHRCGACKKPLAVVKNNGRVEVMAYVPPQTVNAQPQQPASMPTYT